MKTNYFINEINRLEEEIKQLIIQQKKYNESLNDKNNEIILCELAKDEIKRKKQILFKQEKIAKEKIATKITFYIFLICLLPALLILFLLLKYNYSFAISIFLSIWSLSSITLAFFEEQKKYAENKYLKSKLHEKIISQNKILNEEYANIKEYLEDKIYKQHLILEEIKNIDSNLADKIKMKKDLEVLFSSMHDLSLPDYIMDKKNETISRIRKK